MPSANGSSVINIKMKAIFFRTFGMSYNFVVYKNVI